MVGALSRICDLGKFASHDSNKLFCEGVQKINVSIGMFTLGKIKITSVAIEGRC
jgi:hypothetical protein